MIGSVMDVSKERKAEAIQSAVYKISEAANAAKDLPELYRQIHKVIGGLMPATNFYIALYDDWAQTLSFPYFVDEEESPPPPQKLGRGLTEYVLRTGRPLLASPTDRKSTRLNSSHQIISYAVFCLKKKKKINENIHLTDT